MENFDYLKQYQGLSDGARRFQKVSMEDIVEAEKLIGCDLPNQLKKFYLDIGFGWLGDDKYNNANNLIIHPLDMADLYLGDSEFSPPEGFLDGDLPFFHVGNDRFLVLRPKTSSPNKVFRDSGEEDSVADDIYDFIKKLFDDAVFYED